MKTSNTIAKKVVTKKETSKIETPFINLIVEAKNNTPKEVKKVAIKKENKVSYFKSALNVNKLDKQENFSLSGALNRFKKQLPNDEEYSKIDTNVVLKGLEFSTILQHVSPRCIERQRFTVHAIGMAFNKYLKTV
jgi:hypothetical protein